MFSKRRTPDELDGRTSSSESAVADVSLTDSSIDSCTLSSFDSFPAGSSIPSALRAACMLTFGRQCGLLTMREWRLWLCA